MQHGRNIFSTSESKNTHFPPVWQTNPFFDPHSGKKIIYNTGETFFLLAGQKIHFLPPAEQKNPFFDPPVKKNRMEVRRKNVTIAK